MSGDFTVEIFSRTDLAVVPNSNKLLALQKGQVFVELIS